MNKFSVIGPFKLNEAIRIRDSYKEPAQILMVVVDEKGKGVK